MPAPASRVLSSSQLETLAQRGAEGRAVVGETLFEIGDRIYPFIAIIEGEVAVLDGAGEEIVRHGRSGFIGELNLLSGQTAFLTAVVTEPLHYIAVERADLRQLLFDDSSLSDLLLSAFIQRRELLQARDGVGVEIIGGRDLSDTRRLTEFARQQRLAYTWRDPRQDAEAAQLIERLDPGQLPLVRLPGGLEMHRPTNGELSRALGIGLELGATESVDLLIVGAGPAGLGAAVYGASEGLETLLLDGTMIGGQAGSSRRIENYLGFPAGISGSELAGRAATQARKFGARIGTPFRAESLEPGTEHHVLRLEEGQEVTARAILLATGADYRRLPVPRLEEYEGISVFYAAGPPEAQLCGAQRVGVVGGGNSAGQAAVWLARGGALVTLLHRRGDLRETMSSYLIDEIERYGVAVRDRSKITFLHGDDGKLDAVTLRDGTRLPLAFLFSSSGPCRAPTGSATPSLATATGSSSPARRLVWTACSRRASPASTRPATSAPGPSNAARPQSARAPPSCVSSTSACGPRSR